MTTKEKILESLSRMSDDATYEQAIDRLMVMQKIEIGLKQLDEGKFVHHDELFDRLLHDDRLRKSVTKWPCVNWQQRTGVQTSEVLETSEVLLHNLAR